jgi:hypothetical protein
MFNRPGLGGRRVPGPRKRDITNDDDQGPTTRDDQGR